MQSASVLSLIVAAVVPLSACGGGKDTAEQERTPDPKYLVVQLSDLPVGFTLVPGERIPVPLASVLADRWSVGIADLIERERVAGYEKSFWSPERRRIECSAAVYRSTRGATRVFRVRSSRFAAFLAASNSGRPIPVGKVGEETRAFRYTLRGSRGLAVTWRYRNVLASCGTLGAHASDLRQVVLLAVAQQARISRALE